PERRPSMARPSRGSPLDATARCGKMSLLRMSQVVLTVLFWLAVPAAVYRSKRRWRTVLLTAATLVVSYFVLGVGLTLVVRNNLNEVLGLASAAAWLIAFFVCVCHSYRTRPVAGSRAPPQPTDPPL